MVDQAHGSQENADEQVENRGLTYAGDDLQSIATAAQKQTATYAEVGWQASRRTGHKKRRGKQGSGYEGYCICPSCGEKVPHEQGVPCRSIHCPKCGRGMIREW